MNKFCNVGLRSKAPFLLVLSIITMFACSLSPLIVPESSVRPASTADGALLAGQDSATPSAITEIPMVAGYGARGPFYEIYFTDPFNPLSSKNEGGPDQPLVAAINAAHISVDVAAYSLNLFSIEDALINAYNRGVLVRMVMESDNMNDPAPKALLGAGIPIVGDQQPGLMHNKFVVIDRVEVWTGSMNYTASGTYDDNNNLARIRSTVIARDYTVEFEEMFKNDFFGPDVIAETPDPAVTIDNVTVEIYFSPDDHPARRIIELLRQAKHSIYFLAYSFTATDFGEVLQQKAQDGLTVTGVMDEEQVKTNKGTEYDGFVQAGLPVYLDGNAGQMHHKVFIIDNEIVITGSYNFSASAERANDENVVIIHDPQIASQYLAEFQRVYNEAQK